MVYFKSPDKFEITFSVELDVRGKALLLGACFLMVSFVSFSNSNSQHVINKYKIFYLGRDGIRKVT